LPSGWLDDSDGPRACLPACPRPTDFRAECLCRRRVLLAAGAADLLMIKVDPGGISGPLSLSVSLSG